MRLLVFFLSLLLLAVTARADSIARQGADRVRVSAKPCTDEKVIGHLAAAGEDPQDYRAAVAESQGESFVGCWKPAFDQRVILLRYSDGDQGFVPFYELKPVQEL